MYVVRGRNVNDLFRFLVPTLAQGGVKRDSRNGPVTMFSEPVTAVYTAPEERVLFVPERDANPFFHLAEALWMLAGRNDVRFVSWYVKTMENFSDDGETFHGAYGHRWRKWFGTDQLADIIRALQKDKNDRRQVLTMWDPVNDLGREGRDVPCNVTAVFQIAVDGRLDMMVSNRSNDLIWGMLGANAVHFSVLQEYVARSIGVPVGVYRQVAANLHAYEEPFAKVSAVAKDVPCAYETEEVSPFPLMSTPRLSWDQDLAMYMDNPSAIGFRDPFFRKVASPMARVYALHKGGCSKDARSVAETIVATDWKKACVEWLDRRINKLRVET